MFLSLEETDEKWANCIYRETVIKNREVGNYLLKKAGFDFKETVHFIEKIIVSNL